MIKLYINEEINVSTHTQAEQLLKSNNDLIFYNEEEFGIHRVTQERWKKAQIYEKKTWMTNLDINTINWNYEHLERFEKLDSIKGLDFGNHNVIELGCGPFTNLRLFGDILKPKKITLLDPLINEYLNHPNCTYKNFTLNGIDTQTIHSPIENLDLSEKFDVVIMINVLEHCFDVDLIFNKIESILSDGGLFIFGDVYFDDVKELATNIYDAGHPIRLSTNKLEKFINKFEKKFEKRYHQLHSQEWRNDIYFIGKKI